MIDSEQEMADAFAENELLPGKFDVAPFFSDEFNEHTTGEVSMSLKLHWFLPTSGDSRSLVGAGQGVPGEVRGGLKETLSHGFREPTIDYLADVARTAEKVGFEGVLTPTGTFCEDAWLTTAALLRETSRLKFLVAFRPGVINPVLAAQMAAAYQRLSDGRLMLNIVTGGEPREQARFGDTAPKEERYARTEEFLARAARHLDAGAVRLQRPSTSSVEGAQVSGGISPVPDIYFGGSSGPAGPVAARHADVYLTWGEPLELVAGEDRLDARAGRRPRAAPCGSGCGSTRSRGTPPRRPGSTPSGCSTGSTRPRSPRPRRPSTPASRPASSGCWRCATGATSYTAARELEVAPNLWSGVGLVRGGAGTALVGSHQEVADRLEEYHRLGIDEFILSGLPARRGGLLVRRGRDAAAAREGPLRRAHRTLAAGLARARPEPSSTPPALGRVGRLGRGRRHLGSADAHPHAARRASGPWLRVPPARASPPACAAPASPCCPRRPG